MTWRIPSCFLLLTTVSLTFESPTLPAAELAVLTEQNWDEFAPQGKEVDCIYGDIVLRNEHCVAVVARPIAGRNANLTVRNVGGSVIDLTQRDAQNDQLSAFFPGGGDFALRSDPDGGEQVLYANTAQVTYRCQSTVEPGRPQLEVAYELADGTPWLEIVTTYRNVHGEAIVVALQDAIRADRSFEYSFHADQQQFWACDEWWHQAYGVWAMEHAYSAVADTLERGRPLLALRPAPQAATEITLAPGAEYTVRRKLVVAANHAQLGGRLREIAGAAQELVTLTVRDAAGPVANALVKLAKIGVEVSRETGRTDPAGQLQVQLEHGDYACQVEAIGRPVWSDTVQVEGPVNSIVTLEQPGYVRARITDSQGRRIPCKVEFRGQAGTPDPFFGPNTYEETIQNLVYSATGQFRQELQPGTYEVIVSHGPEYDAVFTTLTVQRGADADLQAQLTHSVTTPGWISSDFHSHSSPSGDNTSSQRGRVLNLLSEHLEFAPCTEHNRISTYVPHLEHFQATQMMATCSGMELTGRPLPVNHQNAFPLVHKPRTQDGGGPETDENPVVQIERLAFWDRRAQKVVQGNHPNLMQVLGDRDLDGQPDGGFERMLAAMDVVEVHPPQDIFNFPSAPIPPRDRSNVIYNWLQLVNQGYRIPGVVNTDAHYNFHGSGWLRNYLKSSTDDPALISVAEMIHAAEAGHVIMTNGPYLEVHATGQVQGEQRQAWPGDDLVSDHGQVTLQVRVQCANWLDINRVQLFLNGRPDPQYDFRRATQPHAFQPGVVKFEAAIPLQLPTDTHLVVAVAGEGLTLGPVVGPDHQGEMPVAVANPIFVDVDANGFQPNGDTLGLPLPLGESP